MSSSAEGKTAGPSSRAGTQEGATAAQDKQRLEDLSRVAPKLLLFTLLIFLVPLVVFSLANAGHLDWAYRTLGLTVTDKGRALAASIAAIASVQFVLLAWVIVAFREGEPKPKAD